MFLRWSTTLNIYLFFGERVESEFMLLSLSFALSNSMLRYVAFMLK